MKTRACFFPLLTLILLMSAGLAFGNGTGTGTLTPEGLTKAGANGRYLRMADNFFIIYDASKTMDVPYKDTGLTRLEAEKQIISRSNATLPDLGWQAGLYSHWKGGMWLHGAKMGFKPYQELARYDQATYGAAIETLPTIYSGPPMLQRGLMKLEHLLPLPGRTEIFLFSDGKDSTFQETEPEPVEQARMLAAKHDICFNIVSSATTDKDRQVLEDIAAVNNCSQVVDFDTVFDKPEHLLGKLYMDTDQSRFHNVLFDFDKSNIKGEYTSTLDTLGSYLKANPKAYVVLSGFCDSIGSEAYNIKLSKRRAESVRHYLAKQHGIPSKRTLLYWYGYANPVASNATPQGRALNRRVTITIRPGN
jgi:OmpA-OmpF porin, OOP family